MNNAARRIRRGYLSSAERDQLAAIIEITDQCLASNTPIPTPIVAIFEAAVQALGTPPGVGR